MTKKNLKLLSIALFLFLLVSLFAFSQQGYKAPETILLGDIIKIILNEVSGQLAFNNEVMLAGYNHIRTEAEFKTFFYESDYEALGIISYCITAEPLQDPFRVDFNMRFIKAGRKTMCLGFKSGATWENS